MQQQKKNQKVPTSTPQLVIQKRSFWRCYFGPRGGQTNISFFLKPESTLSGRRPCEPSVSLPRASVSRTHREALLADAAHREAVVAGVHRAGQHLVQVHGGVLVPQQTPQPAHAQARPPPGAFPPLRGGGRSSAAVPGARSRRRSVGARGSSRAGAAEA